MCHISDSAKKALADWSALDRRAAPLQERLDSIRREQKALEEVIKIELEQYKEGSVETDFATIVFQTRKGSINWPALAKQEGISLDTQEAFRRPETKAFTFKALEPKGEDEQHQHPAAPVAAPEEQTAPEKAPARRGRKPKAAKEPEQETAAAPAQPSEDPTPDTGDLFVQIPEPEIPQPREKVAVGSQAPIW